jgi:hypothetical protein
MALAAVHVADAPAGDDAIAKLQAALKPQLLAEIGWDPATQVLTFNSGHPVFGYTGCEVAGCNRPQQRNGCANRASAACRARLALVTPTRRSSRSSSASHERRGVERSPSAACAAATPTRGQPRQGRRSVVPTHSRRASGDCPTRAWLLRRRWSPSRRSAHASARSVDVWPPTGPACATAVTALGGTEGNLTW